MLAAAGFRAIELQDLAVPFRLGADTDEAASYAPEIGVLRPLLADLDADTTTRALDALREVVAEHESTDGVVFDSRAWVVTAFR